ncbi:hypothetical protein ACWGE1_23640 [Streptomyces sp. NPDC054932]
MDEPDGDPVASGPDHTVRDERKEASAVQFTTIQRSLPDTPVWHG